MKAKRDNFTGSRFWLYLADKALNARERVLRSGTLQKSARRGNHPAHKEGGGEPISHCAQITASSARESWPEKASPEDMKILLIEDHADSRRHLRRLIEKRGHEVIACASAEEAEAELARKVSLPHSRLDVAREERGRSLPRFCGRSPDGDEMFILLITARTDPEDLSKRSQQARTII